MRKLTAVSEEEWHALDLTDEAPSKQMRETLSEPLAKVRGILVLRFF